MFNLSKHFKNKELFIALYFLLFILGISTKISSNFYNESRVFEVFLLLGLGFYSSFNKNIYFEKAQYLFLIFLIICFFIWESSDIILYEILLYYLIYKVFRVLNYNELLTKIIIWFSLSIFLILPVEVIKFILEGVYQNWYPIPWNIRVYNSYFLVLCIFSVWLYLKEEKFKNLYLFFLFLTLLSILLDGARSVTLAYTVFLVLVCIFNHTARFKLLLTYCLTWLFYLFIIYFSSHMHSGLRSITRESSSGRYELWANALQCWLQSPIFGCGFYQLDKYPNLSAHPHNLFIQILTETGLIGFFFLAYIIFSILRKINWNIKESYFVISALIAVFIDLSFSGIHIYPITQVALLWLFVFLLKNPEFQHATYFSSSAQEASKKSQVLEFLVYILITLAFIYLFFNTSALSESLPTTPPRFWEYGYQVF